jgi:YggT family protein
MDILINIADFVLMILSYVIIFQVILSWLFAFNVINAHNQNVRQFMAALDRLLEPVYRPVRRILPDFGGLDLSPLVVLLAIWMVRDAVLEPLAHKLSA